MRYFHIIFVILLSRIMSVHSITIEAEEEGEMETSRIIKPETDEKTQASAAFAVIKRLIHERADNVVIKVNFKLPPNYFKVNKFKFYYNENLHKEGIIFLKNFFFSSPHP